MNNSPTDNFSLELTINGKKIGTNPFVQNMMVATLLGMVSPLKGVETPREIVIKIATSS